ncbi:MAG: cysteine--tRNA ligase [Candidatus Yonathbacteria bacterium]|nr:cysteine--tRNA ligase [Candidatus Yonathbacteria bacterium]
MDVRLYNTLSQQLEPVVNHQVRMYHCGPTVYDYAHIGNLRSFIMNDVLRRTLEYTGYDVKQVMNITDIDDKTIARAAKEGISIYDLSRKYENFLLADFKALNILAPHKMPHATVHIGGMIAMIEKLIRDEYAYIATDGVYFEVVKSKNYGALAHLDMDAETESRVEVPADKRSPRDFALWKFETPDDNGVAYDASFGRGRPGWHIECSEMSRDTLGETIDIHTGGVDLIFPHHTNEVAQSEAFTGKPFVKIWMHTEFVMVDGQKMSKSLGNHTTLQTVTEKGFSPLAFRYLVLGASYRSKLNFTWEALEGAQNALKKLRDLIRVLPDGGAPVPTAIINFRLAISEDLRTSDVLALLWDTLKNTNPVREVSPADIKATILEFDNVLGLALADIKKEIIPENIQSLAHTREEARKNKDWARSDEIRNKISALGYEVLDTEKGQEIRMK